MSGIVFGEQYIVQGIDFDFPGGITDYGDVWGIRDGQAQLFNVLDGHYLNLQQEYGLQYLSQVSPGGAIRGHSSQGPVVVKDGEVIIIPSVLNFSTSVIDDRGAVSGAFLNQNSVGTYIDGKVTSVDFLAGQEYVNLYAVSGGGVLTGSFRNISDNTDRPFVIKDRVIQYPDYRGYVQAVNDAAVVVGTNDAGFGVVWRPQQGTSTIGSHTIDSIFNPLHINNNEQIVGHNAVYDVGVVHQGGVSYDLNSLIDRSDVVVRAATYSNNSNQILAQIESVSSGERYWSILSPVYQEPLLYEVVDPQVPISRLGLWQGDDFVPVGPGSIPEGATVRVVTHGWGPDILTAVENNPGAHVWDPEIVNSNGEKYGEWMFDMARMIAENDPGAYVLGYSWIDKSATEGINPLSLRSAAQSQAQTESMGDMLREALIDALSDSWSGELHLLGHSHGSKVVAEAALGLERFGIDISGLTVFDSPESGVTLGGFASFFLGGSNNLEDKLATFHTLSPETFIDSYYSKFGEAYNIDGVVDVFIQPEHLAGIALDVSGRHAYPIEWYIAASQETSDLALNWQESMPSENHYIQDWLDGEGVNESRELVLSPYSPTIFDHPFVETGITLVEIANQGVVGLSLVAGKQIASLLENSPSYLHALAVFDEGAVNLLLDYEFVSAGDGDELGIWIDGEMVLILSGFVSEKSGTAVIDIAGFDPGVHVITFALHSYGDANAEFQISNPRTQNIVGSIPEPGTACLLACVLLITLKRRR